MPRRYVMAIACICHYRPAHKLVTAHLECRAPPRALVSSPRSPSLPFSLILFSAINHLSYLSVSLPLVYDSRGRSRSLSFLSFVFLSSFFFFPPAFCRAKRACHRIVCIAVAKRRSLSSLINVDPPLIYRRVALKVNDAPLERTTLGIPVAR